MSKGILNYSKSKPVNKNIIIEILNNETTTNSGLIIKSNNSETFLKGKVINFDSELKNEYSDLQKDITVLFHKGRERFLNENLHIINAKDLILITK